MLKIIGIVRVKLLTLTVTLSFCFDYIQRCVMYHSMREPFHASANYFRPVPALTSYLHHIRPFFRGT